jgi:hypothetical protein
METYGNGIANLAVPFFALSRQMQVWDDQEEL